MNTQQQSRDTPAPAPATGPASEPGQEARSEGLLPVDEPEPKLDVAEEVSLDEQSGHARQVGAMPEDSPVSKPAEALVETLSTPPAPEAPPGRPGQPSGQLA